MLVAQGHSTKVFLNFSSICFIVSLQCLPVGGRGGLLFVYRLNELNVLNEEIELNELNEVNDLKGRNGLKETIELYDYMC